MRGFQSFTFAFRRLYYGVSPFLVPCHVFGSRTQQNFSRTLRSRNKGSTSIEGVRKRLLFISGHVLHSFVFLRLWFRGIKFMVCTSRIMHFHRWFSLQQKRAYGRRGTEAEFPRLHYTIIWSCISFSGCAKKKKKEYELNWFIFG